MPVQLTYRGERAFNTVCGGCISILLIISLMVYCGIEFHRLYIHPEYQQYPPRSNFSVN